MPPTADHGRIVHHDLMSTDVTASQAFFTALFGWDAVEVTPGGPESTHVQLKLGDRVACALMHLDANMGAPSHLVPYVACDDVDAVCERYGGAGGEVCIGPMDLGEHGRWAIANDPGKGLVSLWKGAEAPQPPDQPTVPFGLFCWDELLAVDAPREVEFYRQVFDYDVQTMPMPEGDYSLLMRGEAMLAGVMQKPADAPGPSQWLSYVRVEDVDAMTARARELGGQVWVEPRDIVPGEGSSIGRFAVLGDPTGAMFALYREAGDSSEC